jgi:ABC-type transport system involved in Fe-S cluster assembly fused permease/ATPase subunit
LKEQTQISKYITERLIQITLRNNSNKNKTIKVTHQLSPNTRIVEADYKYTIDNNDNVTFSIDIAPDKEIVWTFRERSEY